MNDSRIICLKNENNLGIQKTLNRGLREAKGEYIARIDDDDIWIDKDKLKKQVEFLNTNRKYSLVGIGGVIVIDEEGKELFRYLLPDTDEKIRNKILTKNCFCHTGTVFRKEAALSCGGYSETEETKHIEDYDLWLKMGLTANFYNIPIYGLKHTMNKNSISLNNKLEQFKKSIILSEKYKNKYSGYVQAYIGKNLIVIFYGLFDLFFPGRIKNMIHKIYKNL
jgi:glycosyltransferase involved in cell wall biosynthesis